MKIEEAIQQKVFSSEFQKAMINILYTTSWFNGHQRKFFEPYDLTTQQYNILRILRGQGSNPIGVYELTSRMIDKTSNTSRLVEKLRKKELLDRQICANDRRAAEVRITEKGLSLLKEIDVEMPKLERDLINLSPEESEQLNFLLDKLRSSASTK